VDFDYQILDSANERIIEETKKDLEKIAEKARSKQVSI
jgi:hypothetical protein